MLDINPLSDVLVNTCSQSVGCLILLIVSFAVQNIFSLMKSHLLFFLLFPLPGEIVLIKNFYEQCPKFCCLCLKITFLFLFFKIYFIDYAIAVVPLSPLYSPPHCTPPPTCIPSTLVHVHGSYI